MAVAWRATANVLLYDFENDTAGWEHEAAVPTVPCVVKDRAHHGQGSLAFVYRFSPKSRTLTARVKEGFPRDFSHSEFLGLSAWVYIPVRSDGWEIFLFVRCGDEWQWQTGRKLRVLLPGWHQVRILRHEIGCPESIQDLGVEITSLSEGTITAEILIDQVEELTQL